MVDPGTVREAGRVNAKTVRQVVRDLGLRRAAPGSLGALFLSVLLVGLPVGFYIGMQAPPRTGFGWPLLVSLVVWQPVVEELLFRGLLQGALRRTRFGLSAWMGFSVANLVTSVAFVLLHLARHTLPWAVAVFFPSLLFGLFRDRADSTWPAICLHVAFNAAFFAPLVLLARSAAGPG